MNYWKASDSPYWAKRRKLTSVCPPWRTFVTLLFPPSALRRIPKYATFEMQVATTGSWVVRELEYRRAWPLGPLCGTLQNVAKPELVIESNPEDNFLRARCSVCPGVRFNVVGNTLADKTHLRQMFDIHFRQAHMRVEAIGAKDSAK